MTRTAAWLLLSVPLLGTGSCSRAGTLEPTDPVSWQLLDPYLANKPEARQGHAMSTDEGRRNVVMFGGYASPNAVSPDGHVLGDTWVWQGSWQLHYPTSAPAPRTGHAMAYDPRRGRIVLFGGVGGPNHFLGDTWEWDGATWLPMSSADAPSPRYGAGLAYDPRLGGVVLHGGQSDVFPPYTDLWLWDGSAWREQTYVGSGPETTTGSLWSDPSTQDLLLLGLRASGDGLVFAAYDGARWTELAAPPVDYQPWLTCVASSRFAPVVVLGDPQRPDAACETWRWSSGVWGRVNTAGPPLRYGSAMQQLPDGNRMLLFGGAGLGAGSLNDTWTYTLFIAL